MSERTPSASPRLFWVLGIGVLALGLNLVVLAPSLTRLTSSGVANTIYLLIRLTLLIGIGAMLYPSTRRNRVQVVSLVTLAAFFDQVLWKGLWIAIASARGATEWEGLPPTQIAFGLGMSYLLFLPFLMVLGFLGTELGAAIARRRKGA